MASLISELITVLNKQADLLEDLLALSYEKREVIVNNDLASLQKITSLENIIVSKNNRLDKTRAVVFEDIALVINRKASELTLDTLIELLKEQPEYIELRKTHERMVAVLNELKESNDQNRKLVESSLDYIDFSINIIRGSANERLGIRDEDQDLFDIAGLFDTTQ